MLLALDQTAAASGYTASTTSHSQSHDSAQKQTGGEILQAGVSDWLSAIKNFDANLNPVYKWHEKVRYTEQQLCSDRNSWLNRIEVAQVAVLLVSVTCKTKRDTYAILSKCQRIHTVTFAHSLISQLFLRILSLL